MASGGSSRGSLMSRMGGSHDGHSLVDDDDDCDEVGVGCIGGAGCTGWAWGRGFTKGNKGLKSDKGQWKDLWS